MIEVEKFAILILSQLKLAGVLCRILQGTQVGFLSCGEGQGTVLCPFRSDKRLKGGVAQTSNLMILRHPFLVKIMMCLIINYYVLLK